MKAVSGEHFARAQGGPEQVAGRLGGGDGGRTLLVGVRRASHQHFGRHHAHVRAPAVYTPSQPQTMSCSCYNLNRVSTVNVCQITANFTLISSNYSTKTHRAGLFKSCNPFPNLLCELDALRHCSLS